LTGKDSYIDGLAVQDQLGQIPEPGSVARRAVVVAAPQLESRLIRITGRPASVDHLGPGPRLWRFAMRQAHERRRALARPKPGNVKFAVATSRESGYKDKPRSFREAREPLTNVIDEIGFAERRYGSYHISRQLTL
jgi:hypothetical protein